MDDMINRIKQLFGVKAQNNKSKLARDVGMNTRTVTQYIEGETRLTAEFLAKILIAYPDISAEWLLRGRGEMECKSGDVTLQQNSNNENTNINEGETMRQLLSMLQDKDRQIDSLIEIIKNNRK